MLCVKTNEGFIPINNRQNYYYSMKYTGFHQLLFDISVKDPINKYLINEAIIKNEDNRFLIKDVNRRTQNITFTCELDMDEWKETIFKDTANDERFITKTLEQLLTAIIPAGWKFINAGIRDIRRTPELYDATPFDVLVALEEIYQVVFDINVLKAEITVINPESFVYDGLYITPELNMNSITWNGSSSNFCTKLFAYGKTDDEGNTVNISSVNNGKEYIEDHSYSPRTVTLVWRDERYTDPQSLYDDARKKMDELCIPKMSYDVSINDLADINKEYDFLKFGLYKPVKTMIDEYISIIQKVVGYKKYYDKPEKNVVTLSNERHKFSSQLSSLIGGTVNQIINGSVLEQAKKEATALINLFTTKGYKYETENEIYFLDALPKENAKNVLRINLGGIAFSTSGWSGPYTTAWTIDGKFNADFITAGTLQGIKIIANEGLIGGFDITDEGFTKTSVVTLKKTYTNDDVTRIRKIIDGTVTPTATDYSNYDVNMDGEIDSRDYIIVKDLYVPCGGTRLYTDVVINSFPYSIYDINQPLVTVRYRGAKGTIAETFLSARTLSTSYVKTEGVTADYVSTKTFSTENGNSINSLGNILDILCINDSGWTAGQIFGQYYDGTPNLYILAENGGYLTLGNSVNRIYFQVIDDDANWQSAFYSRDGGCALGKTAKPWYRVYASNSTTVTSDERLKKNIRSYDQRFIDMYPDLEPVLYELKNFSNGSHCGLIAQRVKEAMDKHGISDEEFGVFEYDEKTDSYSIAYEELTSYNMFMIQHYASEMKNQKKDIDDLNERMDKLINMLGV